jgi:outer membrane receptor protein involved in Fe transport
MPGWTCWNLYAGTQLGPIRLQASLQNVFDEAYRVYGSGVDGYGRSVRILLILDSR